MNGRRGYFESRQVKSEHCFLDTFSKSWECTFRLDVAWCEMLISLGVLRSMIHTITWFCVCPLLWSLACSSISCKLLFLELVFKTLFPPNLGREVDTNTWSQNICTHSTCFSCSYERSLVCVAWHSPHLLLLLPSLLGIFCCMTTTILMNSACPVHCNYHAVYISLSFPPYARGDCFYSGTFLTSRNSIACANEEGRGLRFEFHD